MAQSSSRHISSSHISSSNVLNRRTFLRASGVALALPFLDAMLPSPLLSIASAASNNPPLRSAFVFIPNGVHYADYMPKGVGKSYKPSPLLKSLSKQRKLFSVLSGLTHENAKALGDGPGDHARSAACFLTGAHPQKGGEIKSGISIDQLLARQIGNDTRFASLEIGCDRSLQSGQCDSGYSCAYSSTISWRNESSPVPKEVHPRLLFERLFQLGPAGESEKERSKRLDARKSILDSVRKSAERMQKKLGSADRHKLAEYFNGVRELELRIEKVEKLEKNSAAEIGMKKPTAIPKDYREHLRLMYDLSILAFRMDITRVISFMTANEGSNRSYPFLGISQGHHRLSHHNHNAGMIEQVRKINRFHFEEFGAYLDRLQNVKEADSTLLDNSVILFGGAIGDGNRHNHNSLPIILAGKAGGALKGGQHLAYQDGTPLCNLLVNIANMNQLGISQFGDSTGSLKL